MSQVTEFQNLLLSVMSTGSILTESAQLAQTKDIYKEFVKQLHRGGMLQNRQKISDSIPGEPKFSDLRPSRSRWSYRRSSNYYVIWGEKNAALMQISNDGYKLYVFNPETKRLENDLYANLTDFKRALKAVIGKIVAHSILETPEQYASKFISDIRPFSSDRDRIRADRVLKKLSGQDDTPTINQQRGDTIEMLSKRLRPIMIKYLNRSLGNILDLANLKMNSYKKSSHSMPSVQRDITRLLDRANKIRNFLYILQGTLTDEDLRRGDMRYPFEIILQSAVALAAKEKYGEEVTISGVANAIEPNRYAHSERLAAAGPGLAKFRDDIQTGNASDLSIVMRWLGRLI